MTRRYDKQVWDAYEITAASDAVAAQVDLDPIISTVNAILSVPLLPAISQVTALQKALADLITAGGNLTAAITDAELVLGAPCMALLPQPTP